MEKEEVLDPHERATLADAAEEAVDDACGEVGLEAGRRAGPCAGGHHDGLEDEGDGPATKISRQGHDEEAAGADGKEVSDDGTLDLCL